MILLTLILQSQLFTPAPPLRKVNLEPVVSDIESHLPANHPYWDADRITWVHEGTHGINSWLRTHHGCPSFYLLRNRAILMQEPATTLSAVAARVPVSMRGEIYNLYLVQMQADWNEQPSYVFDEFSAYLNGAEARSALGISDRQETVRYAREFVGYSICVPWVANNNDPQMKAFLKYQIERARKYGSLSLLDARLRNFARSYFGPQWMKQNLGD